MLASNETRETRNAPERPAAISSPKTNGVCRRAKIRTDSTRVSLLCRELDDSLAGRRMHVLLLRPVPGNDRFGLGPFFRIEPLGLEYIAAALELRWHRTTVADLRYRRYLDSLLRTTRPSLVGIACMHALETDEALALAARVRKA